MTVIPEQTLIAPHFKTRVDKLREVVVEEELVLDRINEVIDRIYVYDKNKVEIVWKFEECDGLEV